MASLAWASEALRMTVLTCEGLTDAMVQKVWLTGTDEDRLSLLENRETRSRVPVTEADLAGLVCRLEPAFTFVFWKNGADAAAQRRIAEAVRGKLTYELSDSEAETFEAVLAGKTSEEADETEKGQAGTPENVLLSDPWAVTAGAKPIVFHWHEHSITLNKCGAMWLIEVFPRNLAGKSRTLYEVLAQSSEENLRETARMRLDYLREQGIAPDVFEVPEGGESTDWVEAAGDRFYFDRAAVTAAVLQMFIAPGELTGIVRELFEADPAVRADPAMREIAAEDEGMPRSAALIFKDETDEGVIVKLCENTAFWEGLTTEEIFAFVGDDPAKQHGCILYVKDAAKRKAVCRAFAEFEDPEVREMAAALENGID